MNVYVLGAGVSATVDYPLGYNLLTAVDGFVRHNPKEINRFKFSEWPALCQRLAENKSILIQHAYKFGHFEHVMTALDHYKLMNEEFIKHRVNAREQNRESLVPAGEGFDSFYAQSGSEDRQTLLTALALYFQDRHYQDQSSFQTEKWTDLKRFGEKLEKGDTIITFNYDSCMERILLARKYWSPTDGFGFQVEFVDDVANRLSDSNIMILHLHGCTGWYKNPDLVPGAAKISLSEEFLNCLGLLCVDRTLPELTKVAEIFMHPTYLKNYELSGGADTALIDLWRLAAHALRRADRVFVIGYSLPEADTLAFGLLLGACDTTKITIVNNNRDAAFRLSELFGRTFLAAPMSFSAWVKDLEL